MNLPVPLKPEQSTALEKLEESVNGLQGINIPDIRHEVYFDEAHLEELFHKSAVKEFYSQIGRFDLKNAMKQAIKSGEQPKILLFTDLISEGSGSFVLSPEVMPHFKVFRDALLKSPFVKDVYIRSFRTDTIITNNCIRSVEDLESFMARKSHKSKKADRFYPAPIIHVTFSDEIMNEYRKRKRGYSLVNWARRFLPSQRGKSIRQLPAPEVRRDKIHSEFNSLASAIAVKSRNFGMEEEAQIILTKVGTFTKAMQNPDYANVVSRIGIMKSERALKALVETLNTHALLPELSAQEKVDLVSCFNHTAAELDLLIEPLRMKAAIERSVLQALTHHPAIDNV